MLVNIINMYFPCPLWSATSLYIILWSTALPNWLALMSESVVHVQWIFYAMTSYALPRPRRRRRYRVVDWDRCVTPEWPRRIAHLHRSAGERLLSERIWSSHFLLGRPRRCVQERSGRRPREMLIWRWRTWCPRMSFQSLATWPNRLLHLLIIRSISGESPVRSVISVLRTPSCHRIPRRFLWHFMSKDSRLLVSEAGRIHDSDAYSRTDRTSVWNFLMCMMYKNSY